MKTFFKNQFVFGVMLLFLISCQKDEELYPNEAILDSQIESGIKLGKKLENPYSVSNMCKAYAKLSSNGRISEQINIETTHFYVRFLPADSTEVANLEKDTTLVLFDHPLDYEIVDEGIEYHDPSIPDSLPTWQYTVVEPNYSFPDIRYEILEELYLYDEDSVESNARMSKNIYEILEDESLRMTDNWEEPIDAVNGRTNGRKWRPSGQIQVEEVLIGLRKYVPVGYNGAY